MIDPEEDGITHINVYSKGKTELGRLLSNFAKTPFHCGEGKFESVEGLWYWLGTSHPDRDQLRKLWGFKAKQVGRLLGADDWHNDDPYFEAKVKDGLENKLRDNSNILRMLIDSTLPLKHYYVYGGIKVQEPDDGKWILEYYEWVREGIQKMLKKQAERGFTS